jgi:hypothetical protein
MAIKATHVLDPTVATITITDDSGKLIATYKGITDTVEVAQGVSMDTLIRELYAEHIATIKQSVTANSKKVSTNG